MYTPVTPASLIGGKYENISEMEVASMKVFILEDGNRIAVEDDADTSDWPGATEEQPNLAEIKAGEVRANRNDSLTRSDWTQLADAPVDQTAWATYRAALRDIPDQAGFPNTITWPEEPTV